MGTLGRVRCAIMGSRGLVAQRILQRIVNHHWLYPAAVIGSPATAGMSISDLPWSLNQERPELPDIFVREIGDPKSLAEDLISEGIRIVFSALPEGPAEIAEEVLASSGLIVISHSIIHRMKDHVPLVIPEANSDHLDILSFQNQYGDGRLISCSNCMTVPLAITLSPLNSEIGIERISISTEQSLSGGGRDMLRNRDPNAALPSEIEGEPESVRGELLRILGNLDSNGINDAEIDIEVSCERVDREHGHLARVEVTFERDVSAHEIILIWSKHSSRAQALNLPSACKEPIRFVADPDDVEESRWEGGVARSPSDDLRAAMAVAVGSIHVSGNRLTYTTVADNTIRGAAGYGVLMAELMLAEGIIHDTRYPLASDSGLIGEGQ
ncbi:MAG: hypothetical protein CMB58_002190 [Methanobacteriota archaeon]|nr:MAG: hypothetical protein CMB58_002190 [Euryarchaeota archaeon]